MLKHVVKEECFTMYFENMLTIRNCKFAFKCEMQWEKLRETEDRKIKFCKTCQQEVHFCETNEELVDAINKNKCICIHTPFEEVYELGMPEKK